MTAAILQRMPYLRDPSFRGPFSLSLAFHLAGFVLSLVLTLAPSGKMSAPPAYTVDLVSLPAAPAANSPAAAKAAGGEPAPAEKQRHVVRPALPAVDAKPSSADQEDLAASQRRKKREELERIIAQQTKALSATVQKGKTADSRFQVAPRRPGPTGAKAPTGATGVASGGGAATDLRLAAYYDQVWEKVRSSWVLPEGIQDPVLLAVVGITISPNGTIEKVWLERPSGNIYFDQSAIRAVRKASPLPPLPPDFREKILEVGINFRPE